MGCHVLLCTMLGANESCWEVWHVDGLWDLHKVNPAIFIINIDCQCPNAGNWYLSPPPPCILQNHSGPDLWIGPCLQTWWWRCRHICQCWTNPGWRWCPWLLGCGWLSRLSPPLIGWRGSEGLGKKPSSAWLGGWHCKHASHHVKSMKSCMMIEYKMINMVMSCLFDIWTCKGSL